MRIIKVGTRFSGSAVDLEAVLLDQPPELAVKRGVAVDGMDQPVPVPVLLKLITRALPGSLDPSPLDVKASLEEAFDPVHLDEEFGTPEVHISGEGLGRAVGPGQETDLLPVNPPPPAVNHEVFPVECLEAQFEDLGDPLVRLQMADSNAFLKVKKLGSETVQTGCHSRPRVASPD